ncbi:MAG: antitoxin family protein [Caldilineaceae bacterium]
MTKTVSAIYAAGSLQLLEPLGLPDATKVQVQVIEPEAAVDNGFQQADAFRHCLVNIRHLLAETEQQWAVELIREALPHILHNELRTLWYLCAPPQRKVCAMLELSAKHLDATQMTLDQLAAFRLGLDLLERGELTDSDLKSCRRALIDVGLPPRLTLGDELIQSYVDER